jgi:Fe-S oxidoreductase
VITAFDAFFAVVAFLAMVIGFARRFSRLRMGSDEDRRGSFSALMAYLVGHRRILRHRGRGLAHLLVFWGLILPLVVVMAAQFQVVLPRGFSVAVSLLLDLMGLAMMTGCLFFFWRRFKKLKDERIEGTLLPLTLLFLILCSGFMAEGARLNIQGEAFSWGSPVGSLLSPSLPASPYFMQGMIRLHFAGVLFFMALLPFTFMRHLVASAMNVYYRKQGNQGQAREVALDRGVPGARAWEDFSWLQLLAVDACVSCGRCQDNCPATLSGKMLSPKKVVRKILGQMEASVKTQKAPLLRESISDDEIWACTACLACVEHCPVFVQPLDKIMDMRRSRVMGEGSLPREAKPVLRSLEIYGDVHGKGIARRMDWAFTQDLPVLPERPEILLWVGCSGAFHPRYQEVARAMIKILKACDIRFDVLGKEEICCGDPARQLGEETLFVELANKNIARLKQGQFKKIVALCPHCFNVLKNEYPPLGGTFHVVHAAEFMAEMIRQGRLSLKYPFPARMTLHDPCYLGRANAMYKPLRELLRAIPKADFVELSRSGEKAFCCGGGGGHLWLHEMEGKHINNMRAEEIGRAGVQMVGTACPYCLTMLEDGMKSLETEKPPRVMDLVEIVASSIG